MLLLLVRCCWQKIGCGTDVFALLCFSSVVLAFLAAFGFCVGCVFLLFYAFYISYVYRYVHVYVSVCVSARVCVTRLTGFENLRDVVDKPKSQNVLLLLLLTIKISFVWVFVVYVS